MTTLAKGKGPATFGATGNEGGVELVYHQPWSVSVSVLAALCCCYFTRLSLSDAREQGREIQAGPAGRHCRQPRDGG